MLRIADSKYRRLLFLANPHTPAAPRRKSASNRGIQQIRRRSRNGDQPILLPGFRLRQASQQLFSKENKFPFFYPFN